MFKHDGKQTTIASGDEIHIHAREGVTFRRKEQALVMQRETVYLDASFLGEGTDPEWLSRAKGLAHFLAQMFGDFSCHVRTATDNWLVVELYK